MPTQEELNSAHETIETRRQIEEVVGSPVGTVKTDYDIDSEEFEKEYEEFKIDFAKSCEKDRQTYDKIKKYRPLTLALGLLIFLVGIVLLVMGSLQNDFDDMLLLSCILLFLGVCCTVFFSPKMHTHMLHKDQEKETPSKEERFDYVTVSHAKEWLEEAKKNNYYYDLQEQAIADKFGKAISIIGPKWRMLVGNTEFCVLRRKDSPVVDCITFRIDDISGIAVQTQVNETSRSVRREDYFHNAGVMRERDKQYITTTQTSQTTQYLVTFTFRNRVNPYSVYIGDDKTLLLKTVNLFEQLTGLQSTTL